MLKEFIDQPCLGNKARVLVTLIDGRRVQLLAITKATQLTVHSDKGGLVGEIGDG